MLSWNIIPVSIAIGSIHGFIACLNSVIFIAAVVACSESAAKVVIFHNMAISRKMAADMVRLLVFTSVKIVHNTSGDIRNCVLWRLVPGNFISI